MRLLYALPFLLLALWAHADEIAAPEGYRMSHYRAPTPAGLAGAMVLDTAQLQRRLAEAPPVLIDVMPANRVPDGNGGSRWVPDAPRLDLPDSVWLPNVGYGAPEPDVAAWFARQLQRLSGGDPAKPLLFYCKRDCWMSWNAAKRALALGYRQVLWYPDGSDGWAAAGLPLVPAAPETLR